MENFLNYIFPAKKVWCIIWYAQILGAIFSVLFGFQLTVIYCRRDRIIFSLLSYPPMHKMMRKKVDYYNTFGLFLYFTQLKWFFVALILVQWREMNVIRFEWESFRIHDVYWVNLASLNFTTNLKHSRLIILSDFPLFAFRITHLIHGANADTWKVVKNHK